MPNIRRSLAWSYGTKYLLLVIQLVSTVIIARLVTPDDIGIYSVAAVFIGLGQLIREFGINRYIVQEPDLTSARIRSASTLNLAFGWTAGLIIFLAAGPTGDFYQRPEVQEVMQLLTINFFFVPLGAITFALLRREMRFGDIMVIRVVSAAVGTTVGIVTAFYGEGYRALVWSAISGTVTTVLLCFVYKPRDVSLVPGFAEISHVFKFCRYAGADSIVSHIGSSSPEMIFGKVLGMESVGIFSRATGTITLFNSSVLEGLKGVVLPVFSQKVREGSASNVSYGHAVSCLTSLTWPFFSVLAILVYPTIMTLYGEQWLAAAPLIQWMCFGAIIASLLHLSVDVLTAAGQIRAVFKINLTMVLLRLALILLVAPYGLIAVVAVLQFPTLIRLALVSWQLARHIDFRLSNISKSLFQNALISIITASPAATAVALTNFQLNGSLLLFFAVLVLCACFWLAAIFTIKPPIHNEFSSLTDKVRKSRSKA
ncbi:MAG: lipopolysaccharide biosynthesis protein [Lamprobacter sp.]|uniref:lipopolysaccharide biosynthesis protein n=1 Tax=Lamprobacter sp. TaxID=3100796 RepID=UPI002B25A414|nr:lipopolysaccharide biosynthesis protein [Lamprobacter sp.]MEA3642641.1 lipopolysaccharide biosynthesis protein [Lamprobacter sp.]